MSAQAPGGARGNAPREKIRLLLLILYLLGLFGSAFELLLIGHTEDWWQLLPLALMAASLAALAWLHLSKSHRSVQVFQGLMVLFFVSGAIGLWLHLDANLEFESELRPAGSGFSFFWRAIQGESPPTLAPGWMIELGLLGFVYTLVRPSVRSFNGIESSQTKGVPDVSP